MSNTLLQRHTTLSANLLAFCRHLRQKGFTIGPLESSAMLAALDIVEPFHDPQLFQYTLRATLARTQREQELFDQIFPQYWKELEKAVDSKIAEDKQPRKPGTRQQPPSLQALKSWLNGKPAQDNIELAVYSAGESLGRKDFSLFSTEELQEINKLILQIARRMARQYSRRKERARSASMLDLRTTMRKNLRRGGELIELARFSPKQQKNQLILLCDVSKSMDLYSQFLIQFVYAFQQLGQRVETFMFSTSLQRITKVLRQGIFRQVLNELSETVPGWSGGTRIGASFAQFYQQYSRLLHGHSTVLILSDGMDTGDIEVLEESMRKIGKKAERVIWLNPLAGRPGYAPEVRGMQVSLPYVDLFAPLHNVESLRALGRVL
ncbi:MAG: VWA domain-containing protein [Haliscomenobacter sp.]|uniref:vWA domain-containing protein n=1 Tax=Haliscomenobacter sp. TaxID=2717303 RepID=UPI0029BABD76|nr:VWA domain-containing protein [Haliscomenobacter sp.]MDX2068561.1 VWA domain-containing protein [Haliscomenobacter sp.]